MAESAKIEPRTERFIQEYNKMKISGKYPDYKELMSIMDIKTKSTISGIMHKRQNIQPEEWERFKAHFGIKEENSADISVPRGTPHSNVEHSVDYLAGKLAIKDEVLTERERVIQQIEGRRLDAEAVAAKMEAHYMDVKSDKEKLFETLSALQKTIIEVLKPISINSGDSIKYLQVIARELRIEDSEIMGSLDRLEGSAPGTLAKNAGRRILKEVREEQQKDKQSGKDKLSR